MPDSSRTLSALQTLLADNASKLISPQDVRDFLVSVYPRVFFLDNHGGKGDDLTANDTAFDDAYSKAVTASGGLIAFPQGIWRFGSAHTISDPNIGIVGLGRGSIVKPTAAIDVFTFDGGSSANVGFLAEGLHFNLNNLDATGMRFVNGNGPVARRIHFTNPASGSFGIRTSGGAHEALIEKLDWFSASALGTAVEIDTNNCELRKSSIIAAAVGVDLSPVAAISPVSIGRGTRIKDCGTGIRVNGRAMLGLFINGVRFEGCTAYDIDARGFDPTTNRIFGAFLRDIYSSAGVNWRFGNLRGLFLDGVIFKGWTGAGPAIVDGGNISEIHALTLTKDTTTSTTPLLPSTWADSNFDSALRKATQSDHAIVATASLPAAGSVMDGTVLIEDAGAGDRNLIIYAGGQRFRIDGGAAF